MLTGRVCVKGWVEGIQEEPHPPVQGGSSRPGAPGWRWRWIHTIYVQDISLGGYARYAQHTSRVLHSFPTTLLPLLHLPCPSPRRSPLCFSPSRVPSPCLVTILKCPPLPTCLPRPPPLASQVPTVVEKAIASEGGGELTTRRAMAFGRWASAPHPRSAPHLACCSTPSMLPHITLMHKPTAP